MSGDFYFRRHPVMANSMIIFIIACIGIVIVFLSLNLFTHHGESDTVPSVENMSYTEAIKMLRKHGFRTDIRDSIYNEEIQPGFVVEQFPKAGSTVKPGRKIFLYINAVHPKEILVDGENRPSESAFKGYSRRQVIAKLEELGFKNIRIVTVPGDDDRVVRVTANGKTIMKMQKVPINAAIVVEVRDGALRHQTDSLLQEQYMEYVLDGDEDVFEMEEPQAEEAAPAEEPQEHEEPVADEDDEW
ncbi:MAG: PASTA domain-containing protein [Muribaculaceae bacterium]|nr:PASTA domain-containing protein [Muribaculaceae bacterium]